MPTCAPLCLEFIGLRARAFHRRTQRSDRRLDHLAVLRPAGAFKLRNGAAVQVNNEVQPSNDPAPKPQES